MDYGPWDAASGSGLRDIGEREAHGVGTDCSASAAYQRFTNETI